MTIISKDFIEKNIWKKNCLPFLILAIVLPIISSGFVAFHFQLFLIIAPLVFFPCAIAFFIGLKKYMSIKNNDFIIAKHKCIEIRSKKYSVDNSDGSEDYAVFGKYGEYKLLPGKSEFIFPGKEYYIVILNSNKKIIFYYSTDSYEIDKNQFILDKDVYVCK